MAWIGQFDLTTSPGVPGQFDHPRFTSVTALSMLAKRMAKPRLAVMDPDQLAAGLANGFRLRLRRRLVDLSTAAAALFSHDPAELETPRRRSLAPDRRTDAGFRFCARAARHRLSRGWLRYRVAKAKSCWWYAAFAINWGTVPFRLWTK